MKESKAKMIAAARINRSDSKTACVSDENRATIDPIIKPIITKYVNT